MMLAWSVIGLVHNGISFLFPYFSETFALSTAHNGYLTGTLAFFWTLSILVNGPLADRIGQVWPSGFRQRLVRWRCSM